MHDDIFDSIDPAEASDIILDKIVQESPLTLRSVVQRLMDDKPVGLEGEELQINSLFGLFLILSGRMIISLLLLYTELIFLSSTSLRLIRPPSTCDYHQYPGGFETYRPCFGQMEAPMGLEIYRAPAIINRPVRFHGSRIGVLVASKKASKTSADL
jgi:hypothetical protein